jgi:hypothetical protein
MNDVCPIGDNGTLVIGIASYVFKFSDFENGFIMSSAINGSQDNHILKLSQKGQKWELVD